MFLSHYMMTCLLASVAATADAVPPSPIEAAKARHAQANDVALTVHIKANRPHSTPGIPPTVMEYDDRLFLKGDAPV